MASRPAARILGPCQRERHREPEAPDPEVETRRRSSEMITVKPTVCYARHLLTSLATVAFGMGTN
jgi:hypothetical protein